MHPTRVNEKNNRGLNLKDGKKAWDVWEAWREKREGRNGVIIL